MAPEIIERYLTVSEADELVNKVFLLGSPEMVFWFSLSEEDREKLINRGTRLIDKLPFIGYKLYPWQNLSFPRLDDGKIIECPEDIKIAIIAVAIRLELDKQSEEKKLRDLGVRSYRVEGASIDFYDKAPSDKNSYGIPKDIFDEYLAKWVY